MNDKNFNLQDLVYLIIKSDGTMFSISKNNQYSNHYLYLNDIRKQDPYLMQMSFGLTFDRDDNTAQIMFFKGLVDDSCVIFVNQSLYSNDTKYAFDFCLPDVISSTQQNILDSHMEEIEKAEFIFTERYHPEMNDFVPLYKNVEDMKSTSILKSYLESHLSKKEEENFKK